MRKDNKNIDRLLKDLLNDNRSGSTGLLLKLNRILFSCKNDKVSLEYVISVARDNLKSFQIIMKYLDEAEKYLRINDTDGLTDFLNKSENQSVDGMKRIYKNARKSLLKMNKIVTLSNSKTI